MYHDKASNGIRLRYFTADKAFEYYLKSEELRVRDAKTGTTIIDSADNEVNRIIKHIELKGSYGVGIVWNDRTDIYPFDILKEICEIK